MLKIEVTYKERIDKYISNNSEISRNDIKALIEQKAVFVNDVVVNQPKFIVREGQVISVTKLIDKEIHIEAQDIDLDIAYEDEHLLVIKKPSGMVVHPAPGHHENTLVNALLFHFKNNLSNENGLLRPGIVHRIDKDTSGLLIVAKTNEVHQLLSEGFSNKSINRKYFAICDGVLKSKKMKLDLPIGRDVKNRQQMSVTNSNSKHAITNLEMLKSFYFDNQPKCLVKATLETGRTHQIRVHCAYINNPIFGDSTYGKKVDDFNQRLHAYRLEFVHPITNKKIIIYSNPPKEFGICDFDFETFIKNEKDNDINL
ncbi:RluA family pseudouridine synthase [Mycoplasma crocodyli]|uniref:Pseudouridine synthase n=1 Tax=Mycoplasma crocodyli (strain ATCC 51981 / MP145) TaxID=512564 RepID=D5E6A5_MYCCM|nr:RluA family pseudouridine synthase [Mycoplasma crocodyli]ADE20008.1 ribosomal large subunit pseudouridine synthase D [Mycoplasma crocodyli MP145]